MNAFRWLIGSVLLWQGAVAAWHLGCDVVTVTPAVVQKALSASDEERLRSVLGDDAAIVLAVQQASPPSGVLFGQQLTDTLESLQAVAVDEADLRARVEAGLARWRLLVQIRCVVMATAVFVTVPAPIAAVEAEVAKGSEPWLLVIAGDESPAGRPGWEQVLSNSRCAIWRFRKAS
ncbi:MAG: hypothetical protein R3F29_06345 [Planctomycetota bacterium]